MLKILLCKEEQRFTVMQFESDDEGRVWLILRHITLAFMTPC